MYTAFYQLHSKPFSLLPDSDFLYFGAAHRTAYSLLEYGLLSDAPFMVLTGDPGTGKTSLLQKLVADHRQVYTIGFVSNTRYDVECLLPWILLALGLHHTQLDAIEAQHRLAAFLAQEAQRRRRVVLIVDEAQHLGVKLLEELRLLSNLNQGKALQLQIILCGQPQLQALLRREDMTQFAQRVVVDYHLEPFTEDDTTQYISHRMQLAGAVRPLFSAPACALTFRLSRGNPRLINQICDMAMTYGYACRAPRITASLLAQAAMDRHKSRILPLSNVEDLAQWAAGTGDDEPDPSHSAPPAARPTPPPPIEEPLSVARVSDATSGEASYQQGMALRNSHDFLDAIDRFQEAVGDPAYRLRAWGQIGLCRRALGQTTQAVSAFRRACAEYNAPRNQSLSVRYLLGRTLEQLGETPEALEQYRMIFRTDRSFRDTAERLSLLERKGRMSRATSRFRPWVFGDAWRQMRKLLKGYE